MTSANPNSAVDALLAALPDRALVARGHALARAIAAFTASGASAGPMLDAARLLPAVEAGALDAKALAPTGEAAALIAAVVRLPRPRPAAAVADDRTAYPAEGLRRMLLAMVDDPRVVVLRLAQELVNLRALRAEQPGSEAERAAAQVVRDVYAPLANRLGLGVFKWELEDLAFRALEPQAYDEIAAALARTRAAREAEVADAVTGLHQRLAAAGIAAEVAGRPKHIHSIHRKMVKKGVPLERVFDVRALRVLVGSVEACYAALGVVHGAWTPVPGEFDDYVARPKGNGYRSLHTAVIASDGQPLEVQIRTPEMHEASELGVAAHWRYKHSTVRTDGAHRAAAAAPGAAGAKGARQDGLDARLEWLRGLLESSGDDRDFVARFRSELFEDRIYVLTPRGEVVDLPAGATPLDFAYHVHTELGHRCRGAKVDGRMVPLTHPLRNAQQVEIVAAKHGEPSRDWLNAELGYLVSSRAREKVRAWYRAQDHGSNAKAGREIVDRELARLGAREVGYEALVAALVERTGAGTVDGFMAKVGAGDVTAAQIAGVVTKELQRERAAPRPVGGRLLAESGPTTGTALTIGGVSDLLHQLARCCRPLPPEPVVGYLTRGHGVTVHRQGCGYLARAAARSADRVIEVAWGATHGERFRVGIEVRARDRTGLLKDLTAALADGGVDIAAVRSEAREGAARMTLIVQVGDLDQLSRALTRLARLPGVDSARRSAA